MVHQAVLFQAAAGPNSGDGGRGVARHHHHHVEPGGDPLRFSTWMQRSTTGAILSGIALGLHHALEPKRQQPAFVMEAPSEPEDPDAPITLHFDPDDPTKTVAVIRAPRDPAAGDSGDRGFGI